MAATWIQPIHTASSKSIMRTYEDSINYILNPEKTGNGQYVYGHNVSPETAADAFALSRQAYTQKTGRHLHDASEKGNDKEVLMYHMRQSFVPGEVTPEQAMEISKQLALEFTKDEHQFVLACHVDQEHIHCHIIFNAIKNDELHKFNNFKNSSWALRHISDKLCLENGLSIIDPEWNGMNYSEWLSKDNQTYKKISQRKIIASDVQKLIHSGKIKSYDEFIEKMLDAGYNVKDGKAPSFRLPGKDRFIRLDSLQKYGCGYTKEELIKILSGEQELPPLPAESVTLPKGLEPRRKKSGTYIPKTNRDIDLMIDVQEKILQGKGAGYEQWAKIFNVKQGAASINYMMDHGINTYDELVAATDSLKNQISNIRSGIKDIESRLSDIAAIKKQVINLAKTSDIYKEYRTKTGRNKNIYYYEHQSDIILHEAARNFFNQRSEKVPKVKELNDEYKNLMSQKNKLYSEYKSIKKEYQTILTVKENVDILTERKSKPDHTLQQDKSNNIEI